MFRLFLIHRLKSKISYFHPLLRPYFRGLLKKITPNLKDEVIVKTLNSFYLIIQPMFDKGIERAIFERGTYERGTLWCLEKMLSVNETFVDVGSNIGLISIHASRIIGKNGKVISFEPMSSTVELLEKNISLNKLKNIKVEKLALSNYCGEAHLFKNLHINRGAASFFSNEKSNDDFENVKVSSFDEYYFNTRINEVHMIKIDAEGCEYDILDGMKEFLKLSKPILCLEYSVEVTSNRDPSDIFILLKHDYSYMIFKQIGGKETITKLISINEVNDLPVHDNIYCLQKDHMTNLPPDLFSSI